MAGISNFIKYDKPTGERIIDKELNKTNPARFESSISKSSEAPSHAIYML